MADRLFDEWRVYEKLLIHDYMDHRAFFGRLGTAIASRFDREVAILDLGCGDARPILPLLLGTPVARYVGVDESDVALDLASERLNETGIPFNLVNGDLRTAPALLDGPFDVIVASFSLHHLPDPAEKRSVFAACAPLLAADGLLALIDVFCAETEPREEYLERWIRHADIRYAALAPAEKALLFEHVRARDYPVSLETCRRLGAEAGLPDFAVLHEDEPRLNRLVTLAPSPA